MVPASRFAYEPLNITFGRTLPLSGLVNVTYDPPDIEVGIASVDVATGGSVAGGSRVSVSNERGGSVAGGNWLNVDRNACIAPNKIKIMKSRKAIMLPIGCFSDTVEGANSVSGKIPSTPYM